MNRFSDRRISQKKLFGFRIWRIFYTDFRILLIQRIADLSNILARMVDLACNLVRILDCDFIVELLADLNLDKTIVGSCILLIGGFVYPYLPPPPLVSRNFFWAAILVKSLLCGYSITCGYNRSANFAINFEQCYSLHIAKGAK